MSTNTNKDNDNTKKQQQDEEEEEVATNLPKGMTKTVAILTGSQFINNLGFGCVIPVLPLFASDILNGASLHLYMIMSLPNFCYKITSVIVR